VLRLAPTAAALALLLAPAVTPAGEPVLLGEAKPIRLFSPDNHNIVGPAQMVWPQQPPVHHKFGSLLTARLMSENHECAPDGCPKPIGCGNHWTELKWIFGSCRQFFGTAEGAVGEGPATFIPR
jgi:hypothetical protein